MFSIPKQQPQTVHEWFHFRETQMKMVGVEMFFVVLLRLCSSPLSGRSSGSRASLCLGWWDVGWWLTTGRDFSKVHPVVLLFTFPVHWCLSPHPVGGFSKWHRFWWLPKSVPCIGWVTSIPMNVCYKPWYMCWRQSHLDQNLATGKWRREKESPGPAGVSTCDAAECGLATRVGPSVDVGSKGCLEWWRIPGK